MTPALAAEAERHDRDGSFPVDDFADLRAAGMFGLMVPTRLGGLGSGFAGYADVAYELARGNGATALVFNMHASVTGALAGIPPAMASALGVPDEFFDARDEILRGAAAGRFYAVAMSERGAGSRLSQLSTMYSREDGGYRIKGAKTFVSGSGHADAYLVAARSADDPQTVSQFLVPADTPGVTVEPTWDSLGMRATCSHDLHLDVLVGRGTLLGGVEGLALWFAQLMPHWLVASYAAVYVGVAQASIDAAVAHLTGAASGGCPPCGRGSVGPTPPWPPPGSPSPKPPAGWTTAGDAETNRWVWRAKLLAGTTAAEVAASMLEAAGTSASRRGHPLERLYRDARCGSLQPATCDVCADWLGIAALGRDPENDAEVGPGGEP